MLLWKRKSHHENDRGIIPRPNRRRRTLFSRSCSPRRLWLVSCSRPEVLDFKLSWDGTTALALLMRDRQAIFASVGDCRAAVVEDGIARFVGECHTLSNPDVTPCSVARACVLLPGAQTIPRSQL